jgi:hypothetical protein
MDQGKKQLLSQLDKARRELKSLKSRLKAKGKQLDKQIIQDSEDLFGNRQVDNSLLFDVRVQPEQRNKATETLRAEIAAKEAEITALIAQVETYDELTKNQLKITE